MRIDVSAAAPESSEPQALIVDDDLFFAARLESALKAAGFSVRSAPRAEAVRAPGAPQLVIVNLGRDLEGGLAVVRELKKLAPPHRLLAFLPHVQLAAARKRAQEAGCDVVVANSAISARPVELAQKALRG